MMSANVTKDRERLVISGISGKFPKTDDTQDLMFNLINQTDLLSTSSEHKRHEPLIGCPIRLGTLNNISSFDHEFFKIPKSRARNLEYLERICLTQIVQAVWDAGISLEELKGSSTGLYCGMSYYESENDVFDPTADCEFVDVVKCACMSQVGYFLQTVGPLFQCDSACSSSMMAMWRAYDDLINGKCERAIVIGGNSVINDNISMQFNSLGVLSSSGYCRPFDKGGDGYVRSECIGAIVIERASQAKREYLEVVHCATNCDGYKEMGITFPSWKGQVSLFEEFYAHAGIDLNQIAYVEAHGTGTKAGDPEELTAINKFYCKNRKDRLLVGSGKSNVGHSEPSSGLFSIIKCCLAAHCDKILPTMHYEEPRECIRELVTGPLKIVTECTSLPKGKPYIAINNFGFGGSNGHLLLKVNRSEVPTMIDEDIPRLVCVSGRLEESVDKILEAVKDRPSKEFLYLLQSTFKHNIEYHHHRAYGILHKTNFECLEKAICYSMKKPLVCIFQERIHMQGQLMKMEVFQNHSKEIEKIMVNNNINPANLRMKKNGLEDNVLNTVVIQTGLFTVLESLGIKFHSSMGYGVGLLSAAFANKVLTLQQTILAATYVTGILSDNDKCDKSDMTKSLESICKILEQPDQANNLKAQLLTRNRNTCPTQLSQKYLYLCIGQQKTIDAVTISNDYDFWQALGRLYLSGYNADLDKLYEKPEGPVTARTPLIAPLIKWNNEMFNKDYVSNSIKEHKQYLISLDDTKWQFIEGHTIDGRILFPATGYIFLVWQNFGPTYPKPVVFEEVRFLRACTLTKHSDLFLTVNLNKSSGHFEVVEKDTIVVTGRVAIEQSAEEEFLHLEPLPEPDPKNVLMKKDIYKELNLRGYGYQKQFRELLDCDLECKVGHINWTHWISFIDNMLQMAILKQDSRSLYVPVKISKIIIDPVKQALLLPYYLPFPKAQVPVNYYHELNIIRSGFIEIRGLQVSTLSKRKHQAPVLEANKFVPYCCEMETNEAVRVITQICLENNYSVNIKATEVYFNVSDERQPLSPMIGNALNDQPLIQHELILFTEDKSLDLDGITINSKFTNETNCFISVGFNLLSENDLREKLTKSLKPDCYLLSRESLTGQSKYPDNFNVIAEYSTTNEKLVLLRPCIDHNKKSPDVIHVTENGFDWLSQLQEARKNKNDILVYSQNEPRNGLLGLTNCLIREGGQEKISAFMIKDKTAPPFNIITEFYLRQFKKGFSVNVLENGVWGSYRHLLLKQAKLIPSVHAFLNFKTKGDLSTLYWSQGMLNVPNNLDIARKSEENPLVHIYASGLNFKDVMFATGKISVENHTTDRRMFEQCLGIEYAGRLESGKRVMGILQGGSHGNLCISNIMHEIPDHLTMEEAVTLPVIYLTNIYGLLVKGELKEGENILIHSATGGIGLSAINIALYYKCNIFVTVGTEEKRSYIKKHFPEIKESHIGNSRNTSFYNMILRETNGLGVDLVLNSLADEKLQKSVSCLARGGRMIEIGKYDLVNDSQLQVELTKRGAEYHGVFLDFLMEDQSPTLKIVNEKLVEGLKKGYVKPIEKTIFQKDELEQAFRYLTTGKHIGKVVIKIRDDESVPKAIPQSMPLLAEPKFQCDSCGVYIIAGGLGGCGMEIADWLATKRAKTIVLISRRGITTGYQQYRINIWKNFGTNIIISTDDITTRQGCENMLSTALENGPVVGIFNLAVVLKDAIVENQTFETFKESYDPKASATIHLDELSRVMCPDLKYFVVFSSVSCGRGNAGQTNYGYSNSVMERICESRKKEGYPGLAIQWGVIGDVGIVADYKEQNIDIVIGGTLHQRIANCIETMDIFLVNDEPIVSSMIVAEKKSGGSELTIVDAIAQALQIKDVKTVSHNLTFPEIGMDSIVAVEIKQTLEREFDVFLSPQELRNMTLSKLLEISNSDGGVPSETVAKSSETKINELLKSLPPIDQFSKVSVEMQTLDNTSPKRITFLPGKESTSMLLEATAKRLKTSATCLQFVYDNMKNSIYEYAEEFSKILEKDLRPEQSFVIASYSLGTSTAIELVSILEQKGYRGVLIILDGSLSLTKTFILGEFLGTDISDEETDFYMLLRILKSISNNVNDKIIEQLLERKTLEERIRFIIETNKDDSKDFPEEHVTKYLTCLHKRMKVELLHQIQPKQLKSKVVLCKASIPIINNLGDDYGLSQYLIGSEIEIKEFEGDHGTILENPQLASYIQNIIDSSH